MKKLIIGALSLTLFIGAANAQDNTKPHGDRGTHQGAFQKLNLTEAQKTQFKAIHEQERAEMKALRESKQGTEWKTQMQQVHQKYQPQYEALLTPEQRTQFSQMQAQRGNGQWQGRGHKDGDFQQGGQGKQGGFGRRGEMAKDLNLSDAQKTQMQQLMTQMRPKMESIRSNTSLSEDQKRAQMQELRKGQMEQMKSILTPEQQQKMQSMRKDRRNETK
jgi:Spy/CpxP family protein refolding chaperone